MDGMGISKEILEAMSESLSLDEMAEMTGIPREQIKETLDITEEWDEIKECLDAGWSLEKTAEVFGYSVEEIKERLGLN